MTSRPWIGTSWKMTKTLAEATDFVDTVLAAGPPPSGVQPFFLPPLTALTTVRDRLGPDSGYLLGAQNADWADEGPRTGEVSMRMVADAGARLVEIGHSERRDGFGETDEIVAAKVGAALQQGLRPLICVGESAEIRGQGTHLAFLEQQVRAALAPVPPGELGRILIAYEPIWAIGADGRPAEPDEITAAMEMIRRVVEEIAGHDPIGPILYGGGVHLDNAAALLDSPGVDGLFVGRAAWSPAGFLSLIDVAAHRLVGQQS